MINVVPVSALDSKTESLDEVTVSPEKTALASVTPMLMMLNLRTAVDVLDSLTQTTKFAVVVSPMEISGRLSQFI